MSSSTNRPTRAKTLLAIAFTGSMITSQLPALGQKSPEAAASAIEGITKNELSTPEEKAYCLLQLAFCCIKGGDMTALAESFKTNLVKLGPASFFSTSSRFENPLVSWVNNVSLLSHSAATAQSETVKTKISSGNLALADKTIEAAIQQLGQGSKKAEALNLYLVASCLSRIVENTRNEQKCAKVLNEAIQACESNEMVDSNQIKVISSILNSMAYGLIPIRIPDYQMKSPQQLPAFDMKSYDESERLKLRAAALLDRLPAGDHARRKVHRDLSLWYSQLGRDDKALIEKAELFNLVGVKDDRILYPQSGMCGHLVWWIAAQSNITGLCGMG